MSISSAASPGTKLRVAARRAALHTAIRDGRPTEAARAAARLRLEEVRLDGHTLLDVRNARRELGRAIVRARLRRRGVAARALSTAETVISVPARVAVTRRPGVLRRALALALAVLCAVFFLVNREAPTLITAPEEAGGGATQPNTPLPSQLPLRGRSIALPPEPVAAVPVPTLTPLPQITPPALPTKTPTPVRGGEDTPDVVPGSPAPTRSPGSGTGGTGTGTGGGTGAGTGTATGAPPSPTPTPSLAPDAARFNILVVDAFTGLPLPDVCLIVGSGECGPTKPHTDANGHWSIDVPLTTPTLNWDVTFIRAQYTTEYRRYLLRQGQSVTYVMRLRR